MAGWIKLHRSMIDWEWYDDANTCRLFIHSQFRAKKKDTKWRGHSIKRGQFITSLETLEKEIGLSTSQIRTSLKKLISTGEIASLSQARSRVITIVQYDSYQGDDKLSDRLVTGSSQASDRLMTTDKNVKNVNKEKNVNKQETQVVGIVLTEKTNAVFEFWKQTFNKTGTVKLTAKRKKNIHDRIKDGYTLDDIKAAITGCSMSPHHMGKNDTGAIYDDIELICRTGDKLEKFRDVRPVVQEVVHFSETTQQNIINGQAFLND